MSNFENYVDNFLETLENKNFIEIDKKNIPYGVQIVAFYNNKKSIFRIYNSKKKGINTDFSQIKDQEILDLFNKTITTKVKKVYDVEDSFDHFSIGSDETGKGDMVGPLIIAAVYVDKKIAETFKVLNIRDSKEIKSEKELIKLYNYIVSSTKYAVINIEPAEYNKLYKKYQNINKIMQYGHKKAINTIIENKPGKIDKILVDRFSKIDYFKNFTDIEVVQLPKAEQFVSVAAASIVARYTQIQYLKKLNNRLKKHNISFTPGVNPKNINMLKKYLGVYSEQSLFYLTKLHFKTISEVINSI